MKRPIKSELLQRAKQNLLKRMLTPPSSSGRLSTNGTPADPVKFALWTIGRCAEARAGRMVISGKSKRLLAEISQLDSHLRELEISQTEVSDLSPLVGLPSLESLKVNATEVTDWSALSSLKKLRRLEIGYSGNTRLRVPDFPDLIELKVHNTQGNITLDSLPKLKKAEFQVLADLAEVMKQPELSELSFQKIGNRSLDALSSAANLRCLTARLHGAMDLHPLVSHVGMRELELTGPEVTDISAISEFKSLETLRLSDFRVTDARPLKGLTQVRSLGLKFVTPLTDLSFVSDMKELTRLWIEPAVNADLGFLAGLPNLQTVGLVGFSPQTNISPLTHCEELRGLHITSDQNVQSALSGHLPAPPKLETLSLTGSAFDNLNGLEMCRELQSLSIRNTTIDNLEPLNGMSRLKVLLLKGSNVSDLTVLSTLPCYLAESRDIRLAIGDTPAVENYPELGETLGGGALHQYEYGEYDAAVAAVRAVTRRV